MEFTKKREIKQLIKWIKNLRSNKYKQTNQKLQDENGFLLFRCCL